MAATPETIAAILPFRWKPGQSGNPAGRTKGSRNKLEEAFLRDLLADWSENGVKAIAAARAEDPVSYVKIVASLMPKKVDPDAGLGDINRDELRHAIAALQSFIAAGATDGAGANPQEPESA